jgi:hypothetical protein
MVVKAHGVAAISSLRQDPPSHDFVITHLKPRLRPSGWVLLRLSLSARKVIMSDLISGDPRQRIDSEGSGLVAFSVIENKQIIGSRIAPGHPSCPVRPGLEQRQRG